MVIDVHTIRGTIPQIPNHQPLIPPPHRLYRNGIIAPPLLAAFGGGAPNTAATNTTNGARLTHELMQLAWGFLTRWSTQSDVAESAIGLLRTLLSGAFCVLHVESWYLSIDGHN